VLERVPWPLDSGYFAALMLGAMAPERGVNALTRQVLG
jgi:hypothetical protein